MLVDRAAPHRQRGDVAGARHDGRAGGDAGGLRGVARDAADDVGRLEERRKPAGVERADFQQLGDPGVAAKIVEQRAGGVRGVGGELAREPQVDVVLGEEQVVAAIQQPGVVTAYPQQLRSDVDGVGRVEGGSAEELGVAGVEEVGLLGRALVEPDERVGHRLAAFVEEHEAVELAGQGDGAQLARASPVERLPAGGAHRRPPGPRVLLGPADPRVRDRVSGAALAQHTAVVVEHEGLGGGGAEV
ncbi:MAG: hypothetical protein P8Y13_17160, partial [Deinococcales bacterium]